MITTEQQKRIKPTPLALSKFLLSTLAHTINVESHLAALKVPLGFNPNNEDEFVITQRPHDLNGQANKLNYIIAVRLALAYEPGFQLGKNTDVDEEIYSAILDHDKGQRHHLVGRDFNSASKEEKDMHVIDGLCAIIEAGLGLRPYYKKRALNLIEASKLYNGDNPVKNEYARNLVKRLPENYKMPEIQKIKNITEFPENIFGIDTRIYREIKERFKCLRYAWASFNPTCFDN